MTAHSDRADVCCVLLIEEARVQSVQRHLVGVLICLEKGNRSHRLEQDADADAVKGSVDKDKAEKIDRGKLFCYEEQHLVWENRGVMLYVPAIA